MPFRERPNRGATDTWLTPRAILDDLGPFDLDPCAAPTCSMWPTANMHYVWPEQDGLALPWSGFVWMNPPYSNNEVWFQKLSAHAGGGLGLTFARTETRWFFEQVWRKSDGLLFVRGRIAFHDINGVRHQNAAAPSVIIGYGDDAMRRLANTNIDGHLVVNSVAIITKEDGQPVQTWREVIQQALGGRQKMRLRDLYTELEGTQKVQCSKAKGVEWRSKIRRVLQEYFTPVERGVWAAA